ncbi:SBBP repeat-containing protein [Hymenobacter sp. DG01]|uniref:SBBP repeat-containing protein n=1 Tax=Hymenobacter sp. DG01 TaxID=2584940 RepID=UPI00111D9496|nr:SBBP repeat-containing protein [Hymenobacter sp. DG01]
MPSFLQCAGAAFGLLLQTTAAYAQIPVFSWASGGEKPTRFGQQAQARSIATDAAGNTYVAGTFRETLTLGATTLTATADYDVFVAKLDPAGVYTWAVRAGGNDEDIATAVALDAAGNVYVTGHTESYLPSFGNQQIVNSGYGTHLFLAKLSPEGQWLRVSHSSGVNTNNFIFPEGLAVDAAGNAYVTGGLRCYDATFGSHLVRNEGVYNAFVAKLSAAGTWDWAVTEGGSRSYDFGQGIGVDGSGNVYVTGTFEGDLARFGTIPLRRDNWRSNMFVSKLNAQGQWQWAVSGGGSAQTRGNGLAVDASGNVFVTGAVAGKQARFGTVPASKEDDSFDLLVARLSPEGQWQWAVRGGGPEQDAGLDVALDAGGNVLVAGNFAGTRVSFGSLPPLSAAGPTDVVVAGLTAAGSWRWAVGSGGPGEDLALAIASNPATGATQVAGTFQGASISLGETQLPGGTPYYEYFADRFFVTSVQDLARPAAATLTLWPNPSRGTVWATGLEPDQPVQVFDALGRLVAANARPAYEVQGLNLPPLTPGMYVVRCGKQSQRILIQ